MRVQSERQVVRANSIEGATETRYAVAAFIESAQALGERMRGSWGVENQVHDVRDVTQGEEASRTRTTPREPSWTIARHVALNVYHELGFQNMAQAQRLASFSLHTLNQLFRMK